MNYVWFSICQNVYVFCVDVVSEAKAEEDTLLTDVSSDDDDDDDAKRTDVNELEVLFENRLSFDGQEQSVDWKEPGVIVERSTAASCQDERSTAANCQDERLAAANCQDERSKANSCQDLSKIDQSPSDQRFELSLNSKQSTEIKIGRFSKTINYNKIIRVLSCLARSKKTFLK